MIDIFSDEEDIPDENARVLHARSSHNVVFFWRSHDSTQILKPTSVHMSGVRILEDLVCIDEVFAAKEGAVSIDEPAYPMTKCSSELSPISDAQRRLSKIPTESSSATFTMTKCNSEQSVSSDVSHVEPGRLFDHYEHVCSLGDGGGGMVNLFRSLDRSKKKFAVKSVQLASRKNVLAVRK
eukprot:TRINITY_DN75562_c0_g1_i1.p1 TRINITY_DN75562_c0_g1~~TRINITY_DN75562_c0_g1_i1.p1  ORF type:complete len:181 (+),score=15.51 TRINITY_DN75562_c0_g1_i1:37-579(+)